MVLDPQDLDEQGMQQQPGRPVWSFFRGGFKSLKQDIWIVNNIWNDDPLNDTDILGWVETTNQISIPWWFAQKTRSFSGLPPALRPGPRGEAMG